MLGQRADGHLHGPAGMELAKRKTKWEGVSCGMETWNGAHGQRKRRQKVW